MSSTLTKIYEIFCEQCDGIICARCVSSGEHEKHKTVDISKRLTALKKTLKKIYRNWKNSFFLYMKPLYLKSPIKKLHLRKLKIDIATKGEEWHKEIDDVIKKLKSDIDGMASRQNTVLNKGEDDYACIIS